MIKIGQYVHIHFTTFIFLIICWYNKNIDILAISYTSIIIHELAHLVAALLIGLKISHITLYPFGVNLKLKNRIVYSLTDEIILYTSGPLINAVMAILFIPYLKNGNLWNTFYWNNLMLFLFNLLPIMPMDGGVILNKILTHRVGHNLSVIILKISSAILICLLVLYEIYLMALSRFNFNLVFICVFLIGNIFTAKEKYQIDYIKELMYYYKKNNFKIKKAKSLLIKVDTEYREIIKNFSLGNTYIVFKEDSNGKICEILTEKEILEKILDYS